MLMRVRGGFVRVDAADVPALSEHDWAVYYQNWSRTISRGAGSGVGMMHRFIAQPGRGLVVDHINGDPLDNRRSNLRVCTQGENARNRRKYRPTASIYKGVCKNASRRNPWVAIITIRRLVIKLGVFETEESAARAYDAAALCLHGPFARLNFGPNSALAPDHREAP